MGVTKSDPNPLEGPQDAAQRARYEADFQMLVMGPNEQPYNHQGDQRLRDKVLDLLLQHQLNGP